MRRLVFFLLMVVFLVNAKTTVAQTSDQAKSGQSGPMPSGVRQPIGSADSVVGAPAPRGSSGGSFLNVQPYVAISERYDSNVLFMPDKDKKSDYVTNIRSGARTQYRDDFVDMTLLGGVVGEVYVRNPALNYVGTDVNLNANLDNTLGRMIRGLGFTVMDYFMYTPQPPAFVTPEVPSNSFLRGIQVARNNMLMNNGSIMSRYAIAPMAQFNVSYSHQMVKFLDQTAPTGALFDTTVQSLVVGPDYHVSATQSVGLSYAYQSMLFEPSVGGGMASSMGVHGAGMTWKGSLTRELTAEVAPGVSVVTNNPGNLQWTARAVMQWNDSQKTASLAYTRGLFPAYFVGGSVMVSDNASVSVWSRVGRSWSIATQFDYAHNVSLPPANIRFESYGQTVSLSYDISPGTVASASLTYNYFVYGGGGTDVVVTREVAMLSIRKQWN